MLDFNKANYVNHHILNFLTIKVVVIFEEKKININFGNVHTFLPYFREILY